MHRAWRACPESLSSAAMHTALRFLPLLCLATAEAAPPELEALLPQGRHTDPVVLNKAAGTAASDMVKGAKGELRPQEIAGLKSKLPIEGVFRVYFKKEGIAIPPDMEGTGPFHVFKIGGAYHLLTPRNFATLYGPPKSKDEVLPFVKAFDKLFTNPLAEFVFSQTEAKGFQKIPPPAVSDIAEVADGWNVKAILYSAHKVSAFYEEHLHVGRDGMVEVKEKAQIIKEIGPGFMF